MRQGGCSAGVQRDAAQGGAAAVGACVMHMAVGIAYRIMIACIAAMIADTVGRASDGDASSIGAYEVVVGTHIGTALILAYLRTCPHIDVPVAVAEAVALELQSCLAQTAVVAPDHAPVVQVGKIIQVYLVFRGARAVTADSYGGDGAVRVPVEVVPFHCERAGVVERASQYCRNGAAKVKVAKTHPCVAGSIERHTCLVVGKVAVVERDGVAAEGVGSVYGLAESVECATPYGIVAIVVAVAWVKRRHRAHPSGGEARLFGVDGLAVVAARLVAEGAAVELHAPHVPHRDMAVETGAVLSEQVIVVHREGATGEVGRVVSYGAAGGVVLVGEECHGAAVVAEESVGGLDDAAGMLEHGIRVRPHGADGIAGVLDGGVVEMTLP